MRSGHRKYHPFVGMEGIAVFAYSEESFRKPAVPLDEVLILDGNSEEKATHLNARAIGVATAFFVSFLCPELPD